MPGESKGGDREVEYARSLGIPVAYTFDTLFATLWAIENVRPTLGGVTVTPNGVCTSQGCPRFGQPLDEQGRCAWRVPHVDVGEGFKPAQNARVWNPTYIPAKTGDGVRS
jgi:hypothetical protein